MRTAPLLLILLAPVAAASDRLDRFLAPHVEAWQAVEAVIADAAHAPPRSNQGVFPGDYGTLHLARDGRAALVDGDPESGRQGGIVGSATLDGPWLLLKLAQPAMDPEGLAGIDPAELEQMLDAWEADTVDAAMAAASAEEDDPGEEFGWTARLLPVRHGDGWLLLDSDGLAGMARRWDGEGALALEPSFWSESLDAPVDRLPDAEGGVRFAIADPLSAGLPHPFARMLHRAPIEARLVDILDAPADLAWKHQSTTLRVRLDRGSAHGVYEDMTLFGLADQQGKQLTVLEVADDHAIAALRLSRFHPADPIELPALGAGWISRTVEGGSCALDFSAPVRAKVVAAPAEPAFDDEGYAWLLLRIDQGAADGLVVGDMLSAEDYAFDGQGRVSAVRAGEAEVLWRLVRYMPDMEISPPGLGTALVSPAWRRAAFDLFGSTPATSGEPIEVIVD